MKGYFQYTFILVLVTSIIENGNSQIANIGAQRLETAVDSTSNILRFREFSYIQYDLNVLKDEILSPTEKETLSLEFITKARDGLIWIFKGANGQKMHLVMKDGHLMFTYDDSGGSPQRAIIRQPDSSVLNDFTFHSLRIEKDDRNLKFYVDNKYSTEMTTRAQVQFMSRGEIFLGGTAKTSEDTDGLINANFDGALTDVETTKKRPGNQLVISFLQYEDKDSIIGKIDIIDPGRWNNGSYIWGTTRPPPTTAAPSRPTPVTFVSGSSMFVLQDAIDMHRGGSLSFRFRTLEPRGLLTIAMGNKPRYFAMEIFDGILYFVYNLGTFTSRKSFTDSRVDDGEWHEVVMTVAGNLMTLSKDGRPLIINLSSQSIIKMYFPRLYVGGYEDYANAPWSLYSRQGYRGCLEAFKVNDVAFDLHRYISGIVGVEKGCRSMRQVCQTQPCVSGFCRERLDYYVCNCANTPYTGQNCDDDAVVGGWDGTLATTFTFLNRELTHTNDISFRFLTPLSDTILFRTEADKKDDFIQAQLEGGKVKVTIKVDGITKTVITGKNLNDYLWHTIYIRRRADDVEVWVDNESKTVGIIGGDNYKLIIDRIKFGAVGSTGSSKANDYIGFMQNFIYDDQELFTLLKRKNSNGNWIAKYPYDELPLLTFKPVTITASDTYFQFPILYENRTFKIMFKFKTRESSGLLLYYTGDGNDVIAIELSNGQVQLAYNLGGSNKFNVVPTQMLNDNMWHTVLVSLKDVQFSLRVDSLRVDVTTSDGDGRLDLSGNVYIGGMPSSMFNKPEVDDLIESRKGFRGCLASLALTGQVPDLLRYTSDQSGVLNGCTDFETCLPENGNSQIFNTGTRRLNTTVDSTSNIIRFRGFSNIRYNLDVLTVEMLSPTEKETLSVTFITKERDGLIWIFKGANGQKMHIVMKDGHLVFTYDDSGGSPQRAIIRQPDSSVLNDFTFHSLRIEKDDRNLKFYLDNKYSTEMTTRAQVQFISRGEIFLGGTAKTSEDTDGLTNAKFDGALTDFEITKQTHGVQTVIGFLQYIDKESINAEIDIIDPDRWNKGSYIWGTTRTPPTTATPARTSVTFDSGSSTLVLQEAIDMRRGGSFSFRFRTLEPRGLLTFATGNKPTYFAMEIFDGILYFVYDLGTLTSRKPFTDTRVDDGEWHEVVMNVAGNRLTLSIDEQPFMVPLSSQNILKMYFPRLYVGGYVDYANVPWSLYSRQGYRGCLEDLKVNDIAFDLHCYISGIVGVERGCRSMRQVCQTQPCLNGSCRERLDNYVCDCANTSYTGQNCDDDAVVAGWDGTLATTFTFLISEITHTNDISFRFLTPFSDTILFRTEANNIDNFIDAQLQGGKVKVTINVDGITKTFVTGNNLNDYLWHTLYIRRRADDVEVWVDSEPKMVGIIGGENYKLFIDKIKFGAVGSTGSLKANDYIGYMQNFIYDDQELFSLLKRQNSNGKWIIKYPYDELPLLTYKPVTLTTSDTYFQLPTLYESRPLKIMFKFKTRESNGLLLYHTGDGNDVIAIELSNGQVRLAYNLGGRNKFTVVPTPMLNDNMWHTVLVSLKNRQFSLRVDSQRMDITTSDGDGRLDLSGNLYIGGMPSSMFNKPEVDDLIESRKGFRGCLASMDLNGQVPDLLRYTSDQSGVLNGCTDIEMTCAPNACGTGKCMPSISDYWCNCNMTGFAGIHCTDWPVGYHFGKNSGKSIIIYEYPFEKQFDSNEDAVAFGFITKELNGVFYRIENSLDSQEFIEIRLESGYIIAESNTSKGLLSMTEYSKRFNDEDYHVVRYIRTESNSTLHVDSLPVQTISHPGDSALFNTVYRVMLGGRLAKDGALSNNFYGIMGGAYYNGHRWFDMLQTETFLHRKLARRRRDVVLNNPFLLVAGRRRENQFTKTSLRVTNRWPVLRRVDEY